MGSTACQNLATTTAQSLQDFLKPKWASGDVESHLEDGLHTIATLEDVGVIVSRGAECDGPRRWFNE